MEVVCGEFQSKACIQVIEGIFENAVKYAKELEKKGGIDIYISSGANATLLRQNVSIPVVAIRVSAFDLLRSIKDAQQYSDKIAVINYERNIPELYEMQDLLKVSVTQVVYTNETELIQQIKVLKQSGVKIIIGHSLACDLAEKYGMRSILIYSRESIRQAIESACEIALLHRQEIEKSGRLQAILDYAYSGIIATDGKGKITVFNKFAEKIVGVPSERAIGQSIAKVIPTTRINDVIRTQQAELNQLQKIGSSTILTNRIPICANNEAIGIVATFQDVNTIQQAEEKIRRDLHGRGLVAKFRFHDILGNSPLLLETVALAKKFAVTDSTVMITGETGTGKELFAQSIHNYSSRCNKAFVAVNCSSLPETLLESELFGYEEGAFTGAKHGGKMGLFEVAHTGTIFLDEIGEISPALQSRLLRVLQEREIMRVGSNRIIPIDVRFITATNSDLWKAVKEKKLRSDLYYRLNVLHINLPPLRERIGDVSILARHYIQKTNPTMLNKFDMYLPEISSILDSYDWPGNISELQNVTERLTILMNDSTVSFKQFKKYLSAILDCPSPMYTPIESPAIIAYTDSEQSHKDVPVEVIVHLLKKLNGNKSETARQLGISRMTLWRKLKQSGNMSSPKNKE